MTAPGPAVGQLSPGYRRMADVGHPKYVADTVVGRFADCRNMLTRSNLTRPIGHFFPKISRQVHSLTMQREATIASEKNEEKKATEKRNLDEAILSYESVRNSSSSSSCSFSKNLLPF